MDKRHIAKRFLPAIVIESLRNKTEREALRRYKHDGGGPWSPGYNLYKRQLINEASSEDTLLECFRHGQSLPVGYGIGVDERCIEYPWLIAHLQDGPEILLDAGSALNHDFILEHPIWRQKVMHILTLAPEANCFWWKSITYLFHDLRDIPIRDAYYDLIVCISTLEHVGCDNSPHTHNHTHGEDCRDDFELAMRELARVLKPGGRLLLTVPFGIYRDYGSFQQFNRALLSRAIDAFGTAREVNETVYRYTAEGWNVAKAEDCSDCEYVEWVARVWSHHQWPNPLPVEPDRAAAARAVACVQLIK